MSVDPIDLARDLIRCPSVTPADAGAIDHLIAALEPLGFVCHDLRFGEGAAQVRNLYARRGSGGRHFCFAGHTDVVPPGDRARWTAEPFGGEIRDGWLVGRGAVDMKGAVACFAAAASRHPAGDGSISLLITGDEEGDAVNGTTKVLDWLDARGERPDVCLVGEPTSAQRLGDTIKIGRRGSLTGHLTVEGIAGHTAYPHLADNPAHRLVEMLARLTAAPLDAGTAHFQPSTLQISTIDIGNPATNVIPGTARAAFNCRFNDLWTGARLDAWLRERIGESGGDWTLQTRISGEAFLTPPGDFADLVAEAVAEQTGSRPGFSTTGGTSDARFIRRLCPVAEFGLVGQTMHKADEAVRIADLETLTAIYAAVLTRFFAT